jgi:hypothetical protein
VLLKQSSGVRCQSLKEWGSIPLRCGVQWVLCTSGIILRGKCIRQLWLVGAKLVADTALSCRCIQVTSQPMLPATSKCTVALPLPTAGGIHPTCTTEAAR